MKNRTLSLLAAGLVAGGLISSFWLGLPDDADAANLRLPPSTCSRALARSTDVWFDGEYGALAGADSITLLCGIPEPNTFPKTDVSSLNVYVYDDSYSGASPVEATAVWAGWETDTYEADADDTSTTSGHQTLNPTFSNVWDTTTGWAGVVVVIDEDDSFEGVYISD